MGRKFLETIDGNSSIMTVKTAAKKIIFKTKTQEEHRYKQKLKKNTGTDITFVGLFKEAM